MAENTHFVGRLATYKYYNMDQVTAQALSLFAKLEAHHRLEQIPTSMIALSSSQAPVRTVPKVSAREKQKLGTDRVA